MTSMLDWLMLTSPGYRRIQLFYRFGIAVSASVDEGSCRPAAAVSKLGNCAVPDAAPCVGSGQIP